MDRSGSWADDGGGYDREPSYQGKSASDWLEPIDADHFVDLGATEVAFRAMGPKGVRFLARTLEAKPVALPKGLETFFDPLGLPDWADPARVLKTRIENLNNRQGVSANVLELLGGHVAPALPTLARMYRQCGGTYAELMAPLADKLEFLLPYLIRNLRHTNANPERLRLDLTLLAEMGKNAGDAVSDLFDIGKSGAPLTALEAAFALWNINRETNVLFNASPTA